MPASLESPARTAPSVLLIEEYDALAAAITSALKKFAPRHQTRVVASLAEAAESYFSQSEQLPSLVRLSTKRLPDGRHVAGGILIQHLPEGDATRERQRCEAVKVRLSLLHAHLDALARDHAHAA